MEEVIWAALHRNYKKIYVYANYQKLASIRALPCPFCSNMRVILIII
jgi:hypothetical protein